MPGLSARSLAGVWHPCTQMGLLDDTPLLALARGEGAWLFDTEGRRYLDAISSWWVNLFGHANPRINAAVADQLGHLEHALLAGCTHAPVVELSERLSALTGGELGHAFYASDGASAIEIALKMSAHWWRNRGLPERNEFVHVAGGYHGETLGALAVTDVPLFREAYGPLLRSAHRVASPDARQVAAGETAAQVAARAAADIARLFAERGHHIAALIVEPLVQCAGGMAMHDASYLTEVRRLCTLHGVHLIADEIAVGFGRTGSFFACEQAGIWPDFLCLSKGLSGGYLPLSVVLSREEIYQGFLDTRIERGFLHSHSFTGNPLACRAALASLDIFEEDEVLDANRARSAIMADALSPLQTDPRVSHLRQRGLIAAFDVEIEDSRLRATFSRRMHMAAREHQLLLRPIGTTVYLMPPYVLEPDQIRWLVGQTLAALDQTLTANRPASSEASGVMQQSLQRTP
jgi:adenosylmethionine-8-amino-7-oxononanoate aminotransferase